MENINPKALNLELLENVESKVTLGFRCNAKLKMQLAIEAQDCGITLSEYVESTISSLEYIKNENKRLKKDLAFYENDFLKSVFEKYKNQKIDFEDNSVNKKSILIQFLKDVYLVLTHSVKF